MGFFYMNMLARFDTGDRIFGMGRVIRGNKNDPYT